MADAIKNFENQAKQNFEADQDKYEKEVKKAKELNRNKGKLNLREALASEGDDLFAILKKMAKSVSIFKMGYNFFIKYKVKNEEEDVNQGKETDKFDNEAQKNNVENMANEHVAVNDGQSVGIDPLAPQAKPSVPAVSPDEVKENTDAMKAPEGYTFVVTNSPEFKVTDLVKDGQQKPVTNTAGEKVSNEVTGCEDLYYHIIDKASADKIKAMNDKDATGVEIVGDDLNKAIPNTPDQKQHNVKEIQEKRLAEIKRKQEEKLRFEAEKKKKEEEKKKQREKEKTRGSGLKR